MKVVALAAFVCAFVAYSRAEDATAEFEKQLEASQGACVKESGVAAEVAAKSIKGEFADDQKLNCFMKCMFVKLGYMSDAGAINADFMKKHPRPDIDEAKASTIVDKCKAPAGADACEKAMNMAKCINDSLKK